jgi:integrase
MKLKNIAALYMASPQWGELSPQSQKIYREKMGYLDCFWEVEADQITRPKIIDLKDKLYDKGATCRLVLIVLNNILSFGYDRGLCAYNHAGSIRHLPKSVPVSRWTEEECKTFLDTAPPHLRIGFLLALYTGQRRSDLARMKWSQYDGSYIRIIQQKTKRPLKIPVHALLKEALDRRIIETNEDSRGHYILANSRGEPWTFQGLTSAFTNHAKKVGIHGKTIHGLRKTTAAKLAELGCSPHLIGAITGHLSLKELTNYTAEADQGRMADEAVRIWNVG